MKVIFFHMVWRCELRVFLYSCTFPPKRNSEFSIFLTWQCSPNTFQKAPLRFCKMLNHRTKAPLTTSNAQMLQHCHWKVGCKLSVLYASTVSAQWRKMTRITYYNFFFLFKKRSEICLWMPALCYFSNKTCITGVANRKIKQIQSHWLRTGFTYIYSTAKRLVFCFSRAAVTTTWRPHFKNSIIRRGRWRYTYLELPALRWGPTQPEDCV